MGYVLEREPEVVVSHWSIVATLWYTRIETTAPAPSRGSVHKAVRGERGTVSDRNS